MSQQITFFKKSACDFSNATPVVTASEGQSYVSFLFNRSNLSAWMTTGSVDSNNTSITIDFVDQKILTDILLVLHNFGSYTLQYYNGSAYTDFSPAVNVTSNTQATTRHTFSQVTTTKLQLVIKGTQTPNSDKSLCQFIATSLIGQFSYWPQIKSPTMSRNRQLSQSVSGKYALTEQVGAFATTVALQGWSSQGDLTILESLFSANEGFLVWLCGGDATQFTPSAPMGYRMQDVFLMKCKNEYSPEYNNFVYQCGLKVQMDLIEVVN